MEEDISVRKRGMLYLQQQRFGKKWKKVWTILYKESNCSISRLEYFECKDGMSTLEKPNKKQDSKKVIKLSDCIRVSEVEKMESCPRDCGPFLVETTEKLFVFAAEHAELDDWTQKLCETAFPPMNRAERGAGPRRGSLPKVQADTEGVSMDNNSLYADREIAAMKDFKVCARRSEVAEKCGLKGQYLMRTDYESLLLKDPRTGEVLFRWPYRFLRRFGRDRVTFSFEAGRRCESGEGNFEFETKQGNEIFKAVEAAINLQRPTMPRRQASGGATPAISTTHTTTTMDKETTVAPPPSPGGDHRTYHTVNNNHPSGQPCTTTTTSNTSSTNSRLGRSPPEAAPRSRLDAPPSAATDKLLTGVKSLNLDCHGRPMPRKNQVKNFRSCPLAKSAEEQTYSQITMASLDLGMMGGGGDVGGGGGAGAGAAQPAPRQTPRPHSADVPIVEDPDSDYSLPFDTIAKNVMADILATDPKTVASAASIPSSVLDDMADDPLYDSIDEMAISNVLRIRADSPRAATRTRTSSFTKAAEHIYDEPEGIAVPAKGPPRPGSGSGSTGSIVEMVLGGSGGSGSDCAPPSLYDDPDEVKGQAWRMMAEVGELSGHEYPYNPNADDYAVPKPPRRAFLSPSPSQSSLSSSSLSLHAQQDCQNTRDSDATTVSPYDNVNMKKK
ncbi:uncharacterized protein dok2 isoform X2 [Engraulis encrasicolus]|uniref:uncharacterized protein dok2 isoform X2 n=1 Tax=Engraulis encrasicolus TaxID=184585 RepID=UPI002FCF36E4